MVGNPNMKIGMPSVNPRGRPASVFQSLSDRRSHYMEKLTRSQILDIAASAELLDGYSSFDAQVLIGLAETMKITPDDILDPSRARENLYDREIGKAAQPVNVTQTNVNINFFKIEMAESGETEKLLEHINSDDDPP